MAGRAPYEVSKAGIPRKRSRSTSACATVQVCTRPTDRRTRFASVKPAERALACHSARSASLARIFTPSRVSAYDAPLPLGDSPPFVNAS